MSKEHKHECCGGHHHHEDHEHECCGGHGHHSHNHEHEHECCGGKGKHHSHAHEHECCDGHNHTHEHEHSHECCHGEGEHHHHHHEHECCGGKGKHHTHEHEHECCDGHSHKHEHEHTHECCNGEHHEHHHHHDDEHECCCGHHEDEEDVDFEEELLPGETIIDVTELFPLQYELDHRIHQQHNENYETTLEKRCLACLVELGEFANETRCFKFWSNKGPSEKEVILEEYVDALHFFLSIGLALGVESFRTPVLRNPQVSLCDEILTVYEFTSLFSLQHTPENYMDAFSAFLNITTYLDVDEEELKAAYKKKLDINFERQDNNY